MSTPTPRDVKRLLESMADHEPPEDLLARLGAQVPEVLAVVDRGEPSPGRPPAWRRRPLLAAALGLAAVVAVGLGVARFLPTAPTAPLATAVVALPTASAPTPQPAAEPRIAAIATPVSHHAETTGTLTGVASDGQSGLAGVTVTASSPTLRAPRVATSGVDGGYSITRLPPGTYDLDFKRQGFTEVKAPVKVAAAGTTKVDAALSKEAFAQALTVVSEKIVVDTSKSVADTALSVPEASGVEGGVPGGVSGGVPGGAPEFQEQMVVTNTRIDRGGAGSTAYAARNADELLVVAEDKKSATYSYGEPSQKPTPAPRAALEARTADGEPLGELPLRHTDVEADIAGFMARTVVTQEYTNPFKEPIEAVYTFPLGAMAAVNDFVMEVGERRIVGIVRPREEAEEIYRAARARGQTASLLTQERPNIFTQSVANIAPGGAVKITLTTFETLAHERGTFEYVFPMVVGPRYIPGNPTPRGEGHVNGGGWAPPTDVVPDADRITPPVLKPGERSGHDIGLVVHLDAGLPIAEVHSLAHAVAITEDSPGRRTIRLSTADAIPNRDFVLRWSVKGNRLQAGALTYRDRSDGFLALLVQPPLAPPAELVSPREITFILDISGSMSGVPIETSKALVRKVLASLRPSDAFNIFVFAGGNGQLWSEPRVATNTSIEEARRFLDSLSGSGGTEMLAGLARAVGGTHDPARLQMYVFCTDGYVGDEERILAFIEKERGAARFFAFGIGSSVNRYLIDGIGRLGGGSSTVVLPRAPGSAAAAAESFFNLIDAPVLVDAAIDWNGLPVSDVYPRHLGDLFTGGAFTVVGRYTRPASGIAFLTGRLGTRSVRIPISVDLPRRAREHAELGPVWARRRIADLSDEMLAAPADRAAELKEAITSLAIEFRLASQFTSFVAVDESSVTGSGHPKRVQQPVPMPQDVRHEGVFGPPR